MLRVSRRKAIIVIYIPTFLLLASDSKFLKQYIWQVLHLCLCEVFFAQLALISLMAEQKRIHEA
jgi:hypothetical protein